MNPLALFLPAVAGWVMAWGVFLGIAWTAGPARVGHSMCLFDDDTLPPSLPESMP